MKRCLLFISIAFLIGTFAHADTITLVSDPYPPYVLDSSDGNGFVMDIAAKAFEAMGHTAEYKNIPFKRGIKGVEEGKFNGALAISKGAREKFIYPQETLGAFQNKFFKTKGKAWMWKGNVDDLKTISLGFISGYEFGGEEFKNYIEDHKSDSKIIQMATGDDALQKNLKKLALGRIDVLIDDEMVVRYTAKELGLSDKIEDAGAYTLADQEIEWVSIGFGKSNPKSQEYIEAFDAGMKKIRESGELDRILKKYGLQPF